jgi:hypothetical protein
VEAWLARPSHALRAMLRLSVRWIRGTLASLGPCAWTIVACGARAACARDRPSPLTVLSIGCSPNN